MDEPRQPRAKPGTLPVVHPLASPLDTLVLEQCGILTRAQLRHCEISRSHVNAQLDARRWRAVNEIVICTHNGPLTVEQARWAVVLSAPGLVALCGLTGTDLWGVSGFPTSTVHAAVPHGGRIVDVPGIEVAVHPSRRFLDTDVCRRYGLPVTSLERSTVDAAVWSPDLRTAMRVLTAPIQQRRTSAARVREALTAAGQVRYRKALLPFLADLEGGAEALSEVEFLRWCRRHGFPKPRTQIRKDSLGRRRYLDAWFRTVDGREVWVEIDGGIHLSLATRWLDTAKDNDAVISGQLTLRFPSAALYSNDPRGVDQLRRALGLGRATAR